MNIQSILDAAAVTSESYQMGLRAGLSMKQRTMETVLHCYDRALGDPSVKMPSYLHAALEMMRHEVEQDASMLAQPSIKAAMERMTGTPDQDLSTFGQPLRAGA